MRRDLPFRLDPSVVYLNHGAFGACPAPVLEAQDRWRERLEAEPVRFFEELEGHLDAARVAVAAFLGADPAGLAFVPNATTGVSTVLASLRLARGDELLVTDHEYNATLNAVRRTADRLRAAVVTARIPFPIRSPDEVVEAVLEAVTERTRVALISHVTSPTALVLPIDRIVGELAARGVETLVDAAHAPGMVPVAVDTVGAAWWTGNGHKWLCGPKGSAVLWARSDQRATVDPLVTSHGWNDLRAGSGEREPFRLRFDWTGTGDPTPALALADAIGIVAGLERGGWPAIMAANHALALHGRDIVATRLGVDPPAPDALIGSMAALPLPGLTSDADADQLHRDLLADGIQVPVHGWPVAAARERGAGPRAVLVRLSAQRYNDADDFERLADVLSRRLARSAAH